MNEILLYSVLTLCVLGVLSAVVLYFTARKFRVYEDPRIDDIEKMLPGVNCGGCGFPGCRAFAEAVAASDDISSLKCPVGRKSGVMEAIAEYLAASPAGKTPRRAVSRRRDGAKQPHTIRYVAPKRGKNIKKFRKGGVHPPENKITRAVETVVLPLPKRVAIPLSQHIGSPAEPVVAQGDKVVVGQLIGESTGFVSARVHASVSGTVAAVEEFFDDGGARRTRVVIDIEGDRWAEGIDRTETLITHVQATADEIIKAVSDAGIVGMGGAAFPTHVKLTVPHGKRVEYLIINGAECEPSLTADHRLMLERGEELLAGANLVARALGAERIYIGVEENKPDAIAHLSKLAGGYEHMEVVRLRTRYPQGGEKQLVEAVTGRRVPPGGLPVDVGVTVQNAATAVAVYEAVQKRKPLVERIVTVTGGGIAKPMNLRVRIGTPVAALIDYCGGMPSGDAKVIAGGPMMGHALANAEAPVTKGTSGIVVMPHGETIRHAASGCIRCAKCVAVCPMGIEPFMLYKLAANRKFADMTPWNVTDCIECGSCSYVCPSALPLLDQIRTGKIQTNKLQRKNAG